MLLRIHPIYSTALLGFDCFLASKITQDKAWKSEAKAFRLPTLPKSPPPPPISQEAQNAASQDASATARDQDGPTHGKQELLDQLKGRRQEVEKLMAKRRAEREGITVAVSFLKMALACDNRASTTPQEWSRLILTHSLFCSAAKLGTEMFLLSCIEYNRP